MIYIEKNRKPLRIIEGIVFFLIRLFSIFLQMQIVFSVVECRNPCGNYEYKYGPLIGLFLLILTVISIIFNYPPHTRGATFNKIKYIIYKYALYFMIMAIAIDIYFNISLIESTGMGIYIFIYYIIMMILCTIDIIFLYYESLIRN